MSVTDLTVNIDKVIIKSLTAKVGSVLKMINLKGELFVGNGTEADYLELPAGISKPYVLTRDSVEPVGLKWAPYPTTNFKKNLFVFTSSTSLDKSHVDSLILVDGVGTLDLPQTSTSTIGIGNRLWIVSKSGTTIVSAVGSEKIQKEDNSLVTSVSIDPETRGFFLYTGRVGEEWKGHGDF